MDQSSPFPDYFRHYAKERLNFLCNFVRHGVPSSLMSSNQAALASADALTEAASLSFIVDDYLGGIEFTKQAIGSIASIGVTDYVFLRGAFLEALLGRKIVSLGRTNISVSRSGPQIAEYNLEVDYPDYFTLFTVGGALIAAALASGGALRVFENYQESHLNRLVYVELDATPEAAARFAFSPSPNLEAQAALVTLYKRFVRRLRHLAFGAPGWEARCSRTELLDWPLLAVHVGLHRWHASGEQYLPSDAGEIGIAGRFIDSIARNIATGIEMAS